MVIGGYGGRHTTARVEMYDVHSDRWYTSLCRPPPSASLALWLRRPPRERQTFVQFPLSPWVFFFSGSGHTSDINCTPVATLPGAWRYRVSAGTARPGVNIL